MEIFAAVLRYSFVAVLAVEFVLIGRALVGMAQNKAGATAAEPAAEE